MVDCREQLDGIDLFSSFLDKTYLVYFPYCQMDVKVAAVQEQLG